jgi:hypothetical protein
VQVMSYRITALDFVNDMARIDVHYRKESRDGYRRLADTAVPAHQP